jgi:hypothetical protein
VLGRIVVLRGSSGCLNTGSCSFHLVAVRETKVAGWCKGEPLFSSLQVGACVIGSWFFHLVGACVIGSWFFHLVGAYVIGSWFFDLVGAGAPRELFLSSSGC